MFEQFRLEEPKAIFQDCGISLLSLNEVTQEISSKLRTNTAYPHLILQSRQFVPGERCNNLFERLLNSNTSRIIINVDSSARNDFNKYFRDFGDHDNISQVRYTHERYTDFPFAGSFIGRNHVRIILLGEEAYLSCFDFAEPSFNREEMFIKITQPETTLWIVSSWHPDELVNSIREASMNGCEVNMLINRPYEIESLKKIPHSLTKIASKYRFQRDTNGIDYNIYQPTGNQFHAKFILMENAGQFWWFVGTTNHTYFGSQAKTTELGIAGQDFLVGCQLQSYIKKINKQRV